MHQLRLGCHRVKGSCPTSTFETIRKNETFAHIHSKDILLCTDRDVLEWGTGGTNPIRGADTQLGDDGDADRAMGNVMPCEWRIWNDVVALSGRKWRHIHCFFPELCVSATFCVSFHAGFSLTPNWGFRFSHHKALNRVVKGSHNLPTTWTCNSRWSLQKHFGPRRGTLLLPWILKSCNPFCVYCRWVLSERNDHKIFMEHPVSGGMSFQSWCVKPTSHVINHTQCLLLHAICYKLSSHIYPIEIDIRIRMFNRPKSTSNRQFIIVMFTNYEYWLRTPCKLICNRVRKWIWTANEYGSRETWVLANWWSIGSNPAPHPYCNFQWTPRETTPPIKTLTKYT
jgi:hypothetical protein